MTVSIESCSEQMTVSIVSSDTSVTSQGGVQCSEQMTVSIESWEGGVWCSEQREISMIPGI